MRSKLFPVTAFILLLFSCKKTVHDTGIPYYKFTQDDKSKLLVSFNTGEERVYRNQINQEIKFKITSSATGKAVYATGTFWGSYIQKHFYYDKQQVIMQYAEGYTESNCTITLERYPVGANYQLQDPVLGTPTFMGSMQFPLWNASPNALTIGFNYVTTSMTINGKEYTKVRIINSGSSDVLEPDNDLPLLPRNVNTIYYDFNAGIIRFDDVDGNIWLLQ